MRACISSLAHFRLFSALAGMGGYLWSLAVALALAHQSGSVAFASPPSLCCKSDAFVMAGTAHLIVRSSWTGMTLYATMRVHPHYGEVNTTMLGGGAKHTAYDENDVLLPWRLTDSDAKLLSGFIFGKPKRKNRF